MDILSKYEEVLKEIEAESTDLSLRRSNIDQLEQDILHIIEFGGNFSAYSSFKLLKELQKARNERREIKNRMLVLSKILPTTRSSPDTEMSVLIKKERQKVHDTMLSVTQKVELKPYKAKMVNLKAICTPKPKCKMGV